MPTGGSPGKRAISKAQFADIKAAARKDGVQFEAEPPVSPGHVWQKDHILVSGDVDETSNGDLKALGAELARNLDGSEQQTSPDRVKLLKLKKVLHGSTWDEIEFLNGRPGLKGKVFANNLMYVAHPVDGANFCPADEPTPIRPFPETTPYPPRSRGNAGRGVRVTVIDTGLSPGWRDNHPWLHDKRRPGEVFGDIEDVGYRQSGMIDSHSGHGTFIAGVIRCVAPRTTVKVSNVMKWSGAMLESQVAQTILAALDESPAPHIISLSAGCVPIHHRGAEKVTVPQAMQDVMNRLSRPGCRTLLVAAAGNDGEGPDDAWFYPAQFTVDDRFDDLVVAVGALRQDREGRACFSNYGDWVSVYEDGEKLVNAFLHGEFRYREPIGGTAPPECVYHDPQLYAGCSCVTAPPKGAVADFRGMAVWSGTSFSTPIVVGRIARWMSRRRQFADRPRMAVQDLFKQLVEIKDAGDRVVRLPVFPKPVGR